MRPFKKLCILAAALALAVVMSCEEKKKANTVRIVMENETGQHMTNFKLDYGSGAVEYEIFSKGYTFAADAEVPASPQVMTVEFFDDAGQKHNYDLTRPLSADMAGGRVYIHFKENNQHSMSMDWQ
jgi:hypothetical protein